MKKALFISQLLLFVVFNFFLLLTVYQITGSKGSADHISYRTPVYNNKEEFDPSLTRLNSIDELTAYCDSIYTNANHSTASVSNEELYPEIVNNAISKRFYHGYSLYGFKSNYMAMLLSQVSVQGLNAIVVPDDIMKYAYAACSQQSIVMMEVMKRKGYSTRKIGFKSEKYGHFCLEVYYAGSWHFFDPDMEPNMAVAGVTSRPGIAFLAEHKELLPKLYSKFSLDLVMELFPNYSYGKADIFPAPRALFFQKASQFLSYTMWLYFLAAFIFVRRKYLRLSVTAKKVKAIRTGISKPETPFALAPASC